MEWGKLSFIKEARKRFSVEKTKRVGEREKGKLTLFTFGLRRQ